MDPLDRTRVVALLSQAMGTVDPRSHPELHRAIFEAYLMVPSEERR